MVFNRWWRRHNGATLPEQVGPSERWAVMWSRSASGSPARQPRAGRVQNGNTHVTSASAAASAIRSGTSYWVTWTWSLRSITGLTTTAVSGLAHQARTCSAVISDRVFSNRPAPPGAGR